MNPKVSVILTTHGEGKYLSQAVASVLAQTLEDFELMIVHDGGEDWKYWKRDYRIVEQWFDVPGDMICRFAYTINQAFKLSRGDYITYLCHDDLYLPYRLEVMVRVMDELKLDIVFGNQQLLNQAGNWWGDVRHGSTEQPCGTVDHSSLMHRRECFEKAGGWDESAPIRFGDAYFWKRLQNAGYVFNGIDQVLDVHRFNEDSVTWKEDHKQEDEAKLKETFKTEEIEQVANFVKP